jgi:hypothetical protein
MRTAFVLHLFYPDVALELIDQVARLTSQPDIIVTTPGPLLAPVQAALHRLPNRVEIVTVPNRGWDVAPLFAILPMLAERGYELVCKLHTKKGGSGYAAEWRDLFFEALTGSDALVTRIEQAFAEHPGLELVGPAALYKSAASHMFRNGDQLAALIPALTAPLMPPSDWGFFAGTMFWARRTMLERLAPLARFDGKQADDTGGAVTEDGRQADGALAHSLERLFGLAPFAAGGTIGLVRPDKGGDGEIEIVAAPGTPSHEPLMRTLVARAEAQADELSPALAALIAERNPLVDYIRHGRDQNALDPNPFFSSTWYNRVNADVWGAGMHPLGHYIQHGFREDRSTGPLFDMGFYLKNNPQVAAAGIDPLRHFIEHGLAEGQIAIPVSQPDFADESARPRRAYRSFDLIRERAFLERIAGLPPAVREAARDTLISVIMPAHNRAAVIGSAIRSVLAQTHAAFELLIVDDGSADNLREAVTPFLADDRVRLIEAEHGGVSAARNHGLAAARGTIIAYLDSDNRWKPWFLEAMAAFMTADGLEAAYSGIELRDDLGQLSGYRGDDFDWSACLDENYVDLNAFCHAAALVSTLGGFDTNLRRMVDWDLILRFGRDRPVGFAPFVGCIYFDGKDDPDRITVREPLAFRKVVQAKHRQAPSTPQALAQAVRLSFAIKISAPEEEKAAWGDFHFAESLKEALERLGHVAHIDFRDRWSVRPVSQEDVAIVLRGLLPYEPKPGQIAFLWNISHPDQVDLAEYDRFSRVYVASASYAELLRHLIRPPVDVLLQATDASRFHPREPVPDAPDVLFCGNSRGVDREIVEWAISADRPPVIYGGGWEDRVPTELIRAETIDNRALGALYAGAGVVLNDHWPSMQAFGFLSNRLFDVVASGGRPVSDPVPSMRAVFGDAVREVSSPATLRDAVDASLAEPRNSPRRRERADALLAEHSFDARARRIVGDAYAAIGLPSPVDDAATPTPTRDRRLRVHIIAPHGPFGPQSSAYIRLLAPLTDETVADRLTISLGQEDRPVPPCDICIVQRTALSSVAALDALVRRLGEYSAALVVDVDDAFALIGPDHPEDARYRPLSKALDRAIAAAAETWFSTPQLRAVYAGKAQRTHIVPNSLDPRLWRDWRASRPPVLAEPKVRMLAMGTHTHGADFALIRPALERLAAEQPGSFDLTVIGVAPDIAPAPWLHRLSPPADAIVYPRFVRWLRAQGPFDVGLAPLTDTPFNAAKSDIKLLDYAALGLLPLVSAGPAYQADRQAAALAITAGPSAEAWFEALLAVIHDRHAYGDRAKALTEHVWQKRSVAGLAPLLADRLEALAR